VSSAWRPAVLSSQNIAILRDEIVNGQFSQPAKTSQNNNNPSTAARYAHHNLFLSPVRGETVAATILIGTGLPNPIASGIDVDALSNLIFVADCARNVVVRIDGYTNTVVATSQKLGGNSYTYGLAVNPQTNKIFVTDASIYCCDTSRTVTVIDGTTLAQVARVILPQQPRTDRRQLRD